MLSALRLEAAKRETTIPRLILAMLERIASDGLTAAILDDGAPPNSPSAARCRP